MPSFSNLRAAASASFSELYQEPTNVHGPPSNRALAAHFLFFLLVIPVIREEYGFTGLIPSILNFAIAAAASNSRLNDPMYFDLLLNRAWAWYVFKKCFI